MVVSGCPDAAGNFVWVYAWIGGTWVFQAHFGAGFDASIAYSAAINCVQCATGMPGQYQIAVVGKAINNVAKVYILQLNTNTTPYTITLQTTLQLTGGDLFKAAWLPSVTKTNNCNCNIPCTILTVGGKYVTGEDCRAGNIHNFAVDCNGIATEIVSNNSGGVITLGDPTYTVRNLVWNTTCCTKYPYPFLLASGDHPLLGGFESKIVVYYFIPQTGEFKELATFTLPGKIFAGQFTPGCDCKCITVGGGCFDMTVPCTANIWTLCYDCAPSYPTTMTIKATTSFDDTITSLAFCQETGCNSLIVTSRKGQTL